MALKGNGNHYSIKGMTGTANRATCINGYNKCKQTSRRELVITSDVLVAGFVMVTYCQLALKKVIARRKGHER